VGPLVPGDRDRREGMFSRTKPLDQKD